MIEPTYLFISTRMVCHHRLTVLPQMTRRANVLSHADPFQTSEQVFEHFLAPGNPGGEWGRMPALHIQDTGE